MISPEQYGDFVRPHDETVFAACGEGAIHFCGCADHLREPMLATRGVTTLDFGQPEFNDLTAWYEKSREQSVAFMRMPYPAENVLSGEYRERFPTGVQFTTEVADVAAGRKLMDAISV